jgi:hypothetical protein
MAVRKPLRAFVIIRVASGPVTVPYESGNPEMCVKYAYRLMLAVGATSLLAAAAGQAATMQTRPLELTTQQKEDLGATACYTYPQSIRARQQFGGSMDIDHADVYCGPHAEHEGQPLALSVQCSRPSGTVQWECRKAVPTMEMRVGDRTVRIQYTFTTAREVSEIIQYVVSRPAIGKVAIDADWIAAEVYIHRSGDQFLVSASKRIVTVVREQRQGALRFRVADISLCEVDVCHSLTDERARAAE